MSSPAGPIPQFIKWNAKAFITRSVHACLRPLQFPRTITSSWGKVYAVWENTANVWHIKALASTSGYSGWREQKRNSKVVSERARRAHKLVKHNWEIIRKTMFSNLLVLLFFVHCERSVTYCFGHTFAVKIGFRDAISVIWPALVYCYLVPRLMGKVGLGWPRILILLK